MSVGTIRCLTQVANSICYSEYGGMVYLSREVICDADFEFGIFVYNPCDCG